MLDGKSITFLSRAADASTYSESNTSSSEASDRLAHHMDKVSSPTIDELLGEVTRLLVEAAHPEKIILFGSHARGDFDADSDLDLLIILPTVVDRFEEMVRLRLVLRDIPMAIDVVVYSRANVEERQHLRGTMLYHAIREGRILHDAA